MYVIFALDQVLNLPMVLCGIEEKYRKRTEGKLKTASDYLLNPNNSLTSSVDVFNSAIWINWVTNFVEETTTLRRCEERLILTMDGYACNVAFKVVTILK